MGVTFVGSPAPKHGRRGSRLRTAAFLGSGALLLCLLGAHGLSRPLSPPSDGQRDDRAAAFAAAIQGLEFREIGPAVMGGRVDDFAVVESDPKIVYAGLASGGVWKTTNAGTTWTPVFDRESVSSIGSLAVAPSDPSIVWVGTGEPNNRQSSSWGNGVYKSTDAGRTWRHMGLAETHHIGRVVIHPRDPDVVYVAALGRLWGPNPERGVYKTTDGGRTWRRALFINEDTGAVDLAMDPRSPGIVLAAAYQRRRTVFGFDGGGPHSAIYKTVDGGDSWRRLTVGLPYENETGGRTGRIGLNMYRRNPAIVYATVEHARGGVFRSEDGGESWTKMSDTNPRPAYFSKLRVDPNNDLRLWVMGKPLYNSEDGGRTFTSPPVRRIHGDHHALWINPQDSNHMILGCDGGIHWSWDRGRTWEVVDNLAIGQFYQLDVDMRKPYFIYGGLQDNGSWGGPSMTLMAKGVTNINNDDWFRIGGADGFYVRVDPTDPNTVYAETQDGNLFRRDLRTFASVPIRPLERAGDPAYRFQWNSPLVLSARDPKTLYFGAQFVFRSADRGDSWTIISPDLTTGADRDGLPIMGRIPDGLTLSRHDGVEHWPCITTISESAADHDVIWAGTDDGNLQVTRDGGRTWRNVAGRVPGLPAGTYVSRVAASRHAPETVYAVFDGHRMNDFGVYVYATADFGDSWRAISRGIPQNNGVANVILEHHRNPDLLFVGTEFGAYVSFDRGAGWLPLRLNLPTVPVDDIVIHPRENDLILGTHGRSIWILDDITALEELGPEALGSPVHLFGLRPATTWRIHAHEAAPGHKIFTGPNPPYGALINYYLKEGLKPPAEVKIRIEDDAGTTVRELIGPAAAGINRTAWDLRHDPPAGSRAVSGAAALRQGPLVEPGTYRVIITAGGESRSGRLVVEDDPRIVIAPPDRAARRDALMRVHEVSGAALVSLGSVAGLRRSTRSALALLRGPAVPEDLARSAAAFAARADEIQARFIAPPLPEGWAGPPLERRPPTIVQRLGRLSDMLEGRPAAPTAGQSAELDAVAALVKAAAEELDRLIGDLPDLNAKLNQAGVPPIVVGRR